MALLHNTIIWRQIGGPLLCSTATAVWLQHRATGRSIAVVNVYMPPPGSLFHTKGRKWRLFRRKGKANHRERWAERCMRLEFVSFM